MSKSVITQPALPNPGPWVAAGPYAVLDDLGETVATCPGLNKAANQRLIAAAPDLRDALANLVDAHTNMRLCEKRGGSFFSEACQRLDEAFVVAESVISQAAKGEQA